MSFMNLLISSKSLITILSSLKLFCALNDAHKGQYYFGRENFGIIWNEGDCSWTFKKILFQSC